MNSRELFQQLIAAMKINADTSEKEAIATMVMEHEFGISRTDLIRDLDVTYHKSSLDAIVERLNKNEPVQYILGVAHFYGRDFLVNKSVLIPRPETELLVEEVLKRIKSGDKSFSIIDVGTGSGCIPVTISLKHPSVSVYATDISEEALLVARKNSTSLGADVTFHLHNILDSQLNMGPFNIIVSNPPYISIEEKGSMAENVVRYEPEIALFVPDSDPLKFYKALAKQARDTLKSDGWIITEINERFGKETAAVFQSQGFVDIEVIKDLDNKDRFVVARKL